MDYAADVVRKFACCRRDSVGLCSPGTEWTATGYRYHQGAIDFKAIDFKCNIRGTAEFPEMPYC